MGYMLRQIEKRGQWVPGYIPAARVRVTPENKMGPKRPNALERAFAELASHKNEERAQREAAALAQVRSRKPGMWGSVKAKLSGLFRRKV